MIILLNLLAGTTGGQITRAKALITGIDLITDDVQLIVLKDKTVLNDLISYKKTKFINVSLGEGIFKIIKRIYWENFKLNSVIQNENINLYLTFSHSLPFTKLKVPTLVGLSNLLSFYPEALKEESFLYQVKFKILKKNILYSLNKADAIIALSETAKLFLIKLGINYSKIKFIPIGVDKKWFIQIDKDITLISLNLTKPFILYVSNFYRYKNFSRLIKAYSLLPKKNINETKLVLVGKFENIKYVNELKKEIKKLNLTEDIIMLPSQNDNILQVLYQSAEFFIFPSLVENCPNILLEAMASGSAITTTNINPMIEYCKNSATYFDGNNIHDIRDHIYELMENKELTKDLKMKSKERAINFSWNKFVQNVVFESRLLINSTIQKNNLSKKSFNE